MPPPTLAEQLTLQFYAWERRGRGWDVWDYAVDLEPPYRPFIRFLPWTPRPGDDDGRHHTVLSALVERLRSRFLLPKADSSDAVSFEIPEPEPEILEGDANSAEIQISLPPDFRVNREAAEQLLFSLSYLSAPVSFEAIGTSDTIGVQLAARVADVPEVRAQLRAHFPEAGLAEENGYLRHAWGEAAPRETAIVDFGLSREFMLPLRTFRSFDVDPLIGVFGALENLRQGETGLLQVVLQAARYPWSESILRAVSDGDGGSFFEDAPDFPSLARDKIERPLFAAVVRVSARSPSAGRAREIVRAIGSSLAAFANPTANEFIPLANDGYDDLEHEEDLLTRTTHRSGMLLSSEELVSLVHLPSASVRSQKFHRETRKTRAALAASAVLDVVLGENVHQGKVSRVGLTADQRTRHVYAIGASGTGKSTLLMSLILQDLEAGRGLAVLDPHGDLIEQILGRVSEKRMEDVVLIDPSDEDWPVGLNILEAHSGVEKNLLSSDLVSVFRRLSTSWGDQMTSVLGNAVLAFLESPRGGTLSDLRRFLVEPEFRRDYLGSVADPEVVYYWQKEFPLLSGKPQAPILTRLDTFLRPKLIRNMVCEKKTRLDFARLMDDGKIVLAKLAQGGIGEENSYLLGTLLVSKLHQAALGREGLPEAERRPFHLYIDEFHNFVTPSMASILSGARKYKLGLVLAHQDLRQLGSRDADLLSSVLANAATRICFRVGDDDARKLAEGFAHFDARDLQSLGVGEAICRIDRADADFNLRTEPLTSVEPAMGTERRNRLVALSRDRYATQRDQIEATLLPTAMPPEHVAPAQSPAARSSAPTVEHAAPLPKPPREAPRPRPSRSPSPPTPGRGGPQHKYLQELIKRWGEAHGWKATIEKQILNGLGSVDVALEKHDLSVACEISVTSTPEQEIQNIRKCLAAGMSLVVALALTPKNVSRTRDLAARCLTADDLRRVTFQQPEQFLSYLAASHSPRAPGDATTRGYRLHVTHASGASPAHELARKAISEVILAGTTRMRRPR